MEKKTAIIIGAGVAGLTAAYEFLEKTYIVPIILESTNDIGGIAKTINYKGNRMDIGGHRFFSKSDRIMNWWQNVMPVQNDLNINEEKIMLIRNRKSRIYYMKKFFDYPIKLSYGTLANLGMSKTARIGASYIKSRVRPIKQEKSMEDFFINRFGRELYETFFQDYTEKVWGVPCSEIKPEWGAQRIKGISVSEVLRHALKSAFSLKAIRNGDISQKNTETSLVERFIYPKYGVGQMWEQVAAAVCSKGGKLYMNHKVTQVICNYGKAVEVKALNSETGEEVTFKGDYILSTMPVRDLIASITAEVPRRVRSIAEGLMYRDFISVGLLLRNFLQKTKNGGASTENIKDNWIYIQEKYVKVGRLQVFNNWSPYMVNDESNIWVGLEYFCNEGDELWNMKDEELEHFAVKELVDLEMVDVDDVLDAVVVRMPKAYPSYINTYESFDEIRRYVDSIKNLYLIGRNGMHRYNNMDHSMLTAITAVESIKAGMRTKESIWAVNTEKEYHEEKKNQVPGANEQPDAMRCAEV